MQDDFPKTRKKSYQSSLVLLEGPRSSNAGELETVREVIMPRLMELLGPLA